MGFLQGMVGSGVGAEGLSLLKDLVKKFLALCTLVAISLAFCAPARASDDAPLRTTYWKLTNLGDTLKQTEPLKGEAHLIFAAHEQRVSGSDGCNRIMGGFELNGDNLRLGRVPATRMACLDGMEQEQRFLKSLGDVAHYRISGDQLELLNGSGLVLARFVAVPLR